MQRLFKCQELVLGATASSASASAVSVCGRVQKVVQGAKDCDCASARLVQRLQV